MKPVNHALQADYQQPHRSINTDESSSTQARGKSVQAVFPKDPSMPRQSAELLQERHRQIAELAYLKAEQRGFEPGHEMEDWLAAEAEVDKASRPLELY
jgi:hypothetical protein